MRTPPTPPEIRRQTVSDGYQLHVRVWRPTRRDPTSTVVYLHGIQSHGQWFEWSASRLAQCGHLVLLPDRRGSGLNQAARGDTPSAERWLADLDELAEWAMREFGAAQFGVVGVSWGGKLAVAWTLLHPELVRRVLLIAPGLFPAVDVGIVNRLRIGGCLVADPTRRFPIPLNDPALFTDNPAGREFIAADPLKLTHATARFFRQSSRLDRRLVRARRGVLHAETTLLLAGRDRIVRNAPTIRWLGHLAVRPPILHTFPEAAHTLEFEPDTTALERVIERWAAE